MLNPEIKFFSQRLFLLFLFFYAAGPGQQVHSLVFSEHSDSEEPGAEDSQPCSVHKALYLH